MSAEKLSALFAEIGLCGCGDAGQAAWALKITLEDRDPSVSARTLLLRYFFLARGWIEHGGHDSLSEGCKLTPDGELLKKALEEAFGE